ncbi:hypothetical protein L0P88_10300 [Muricauda sp. SCSIO 64092]|uniref:hypothetical protein n=1 Tax=Allomuricauda sp. SCSIO 64092 TaxID=2908842 RepID=UPI001FF385F6|nr:hypothetical protein [Muricauda sp. SCSIO 64092]UOY08924.1 hypothetical protein L0P88_10300 [Muricauda sp. SCSIO 64092]
MDFKSILDKMVTCKKTSGSSLRMWQETVVLYRLFFPGGANNSLETTLNYCYFDVKGHFVAGHPSFWKTDAYAINSPSGSMTLKQMAPKLKNQ